MLASSKWFMEENFIIFIITKGVLVPLINLDRDGFYNNYFCTVKTIEGDEVL